MQKNKATLIGLGAIVMWSAIVGLVRAVSGYFGAVGGAALIYSLAAVLLCMSVGFPDLRRFSRAYLCWGTLLFVSYEVCLALSIGLASSDRQAVEVGMINYLWPTLTIMAAIVFNRQKCHAWVVLGLALSIVGIVWILAADSGFDWQGTVDNMASNPLSYGLAFLGAFIWAAYCTVTAKMGQGNNGITWYFMLVAVFLWGQFLLTDSAPWVVSWTSIAVLLATALAMGLGYATWNVGLLHGNVTLLAGASYFIPVISAFLSASFLRIPLSVAFWQGAMMVCAGSIVCWLAMRKSA